LVESHVRPLTGVSGLHAFDENSRNANDTAHAFTAQIRAVARIDPPFPGVAER